MMPRLRELGVAIGGFPTGAQNAITDIVGVRVGHTTLIKGEGRLIVGSGPVRTGVTVIEPRAGLLVRDQPLFAGAFSLNGNGEVTGLEWIRESGLLTTPIAITNTHSVGTVRDALVAHELRRKASSSQVGLVRWSLPVVGETFDGTLNDIDGQHVTAEDVFRAADTASGGPVLEGNVGGGTGMICHGFKGGIGTSSRKLPAHDGGWTVGVLVQANYGRREDLRVDGVPVGRRIPSEEVPVPTLPTGAAGSGSIIAVVATDAPLLPDQCRRVATRAAIGLARVGGGASDSSGDIMVAFSTAQVSVPAEHYSGSLPLSVVVDAIPHQRLSPLFQATADATEEAIVNALLAAETMIGRDGVTAVGLDPDLLCEAMDQR
jgi:D-aminopeptidase